MDELWKRHLAEQKMLGRPPTEKPRVILEGSNDAIIMNSFPDSKSYFIQYVSHSHGFNNKQTVINFTAKSTKSGYTKSTLGIVDMDHDYDGKLLKKSIENYCKELSIDFDRVDTFVKDTREMSCLFSLVSNLIGDKFSWMKKLQTDLLLPSSWNTEYSIVVAIAKFRTYLHFDYHSGKLKHKDIPLDAYESTNKSSRGISFNLWMDLFLKYKSESNLVYLNDHCLEATIHDYIIESNNLSINRINLQRINSVVRKRLCQTIKENQLTMKDVLNHINASEIFSV